MFHAVEKSLCNVGRIVLALNFDERPDNFDTCCSSLVERLCRVNEWMCWTGPTLSPSSASRLLAEDVSSWCWPPTNGPACQQPGLAVKTANESHQLMQNNGGWLVGGGSPTSPPHVLIGLSSPVRQPAGILVTAGHRQPGHQSQVGVG